MKFEYSFSLFAKHSKCVSFLVFGGFFFLGPQKEQTGKVMVNKSLIKAGLESGSVTLRGFCDLSGLQFQPLLIQHRFRAQ